MLPVVIDLAPEGFRPDGSSTSSSAKVGDCWSPVGQRIVVCCWRTMKEVGLLIQVFFQFPSFLLHDHKITTRTNTPQWVLTFFFFCRRSWKKFLSQPPTKGRKMRKKKESLLAECSLPTKLKIWETQQWKLYFLHNIKVFFCLFFLPLQIYLYLSLRCD